MRNAIVHLSCTLNLQKLAYKITRIERSCNWSGSFDVLGPGSIAPEF